MAIILRTALRAALIVGALGLAKPGLAADVVGDKAGAQPEVANLRGSTIPVANAQDAAAGTNTLSRNTGADPMAVPTGNPGSGANAPPRQLSVRARWSK